MKRDRVVLWLSLISSLSAYTPVQVCPTQCLTCSAYENCTACKDGYFNDDGDPTCSGLCPFNCVSCSSESACTKCKPGFYNSEAVTNCSLSCPSPCSACSSATYCTTCKEGYYSDGQEGCSQCPESCVSCIGPDKCSGCKSDFTGEACEQCKDGRYGTKCDLGCQSRCKSNICDRQDGLCSACDDGFFLDDSRNCGPCNSGCAICGTSGECSSCKVGFAGHNCEQCINGQYGYDCKLHCKQSCSNNICRKEDGLCTACRDGDFLYGDGYCLECPNGCASCVDRTKCSGCKPGFIGKICESCVAGKHGENCEYDCPDNCQKCSSDTYCTTCKKGFYNGRAPDFDCRHRCPDRCSSCTSSTSCTTCRSIHFTGKACQNCVAGKYGTECVESCPIKCLNKFCNQDTGNCQSCLPGFTGNKCEHCTDGKYGDDCNVDCSENCKQCRRNNGVCTACGNGYYLNISGKCDGCRKGCELCKSYSQCSSCKSGFTGAHCESCVAGKHGNNCGQNCPRKCQTCSSSSQCKSCMNGYYSGISSSEGQFYNDCRHRCPDSCSSCTSYTKCTACKTGYIGDACEKCVNGKKYGSLCHRLCSILCLNSLCDRNSGNCLKCPLGFTGVKCDHCEDGKRGNRCDLPCPRNCKNKRCERNNGFCIDGCINDTFYDKTCNSLCSNNCKGRKCGQYDVICIDGCINDNFNDNVCDKCIQGFHNTTCLSRCPVNCNYDTCKKTDGKCSLGCKVGFAGDDCSYCANGRYGEKCDKNCPANCFNSKCDSQSGNCAKCEVGFHGINCTDQCSTWCNIKTCQQNNGTCLSGCRTGYSGDMCCVEGYNCQSCSSNENCATCMPGWHGDQCNQKCPENCTDDGCSKNDGRCFGCKGPSYGIKCENQCPINCLQNDTTRRCNEQTGNCLGECVPGYHGEICDRPCSVNCNNRTCNKDGTACLLGCIPGQTGINCADDARGSWSIGLSIGIVVALAFIIVIVVGLVMYRRHHGGKSQNTDSPTEERGAMTMSNMRTPRQASMSDRAEGLVPSTVTSDFGEEADTEDDVIDYVVDDVATYGNIGSIRKRIAVVELREYVVFTPHNDLVAEFKVLPKGLIKGFAVSKQPQNSARNRYANIYPYDENRVKLTGRFTSSDYINASYINGHNNERAYIASLGPTKAVMEKFDIFWDMVWQENVEKIVMLTNLIENRQMKCEQYWPDVKSTLTYGRVTVMNLHEDVNADYVVRHFSVTMGNQKRTVSQVHFTAWPDKGVPDHVTSIVEFHNRVKSLKHEMNGPILVHCSAGIGRTGTYIALDILTDEGEATGHVDIYNCVMALRQQRVNMVQTEKQYVYLHKAVAHTLTFASQPIRADEFQETTTKTTEQEFDNKFQILAETMEHATEEEEKARKKNKTFTTLNRKGADIPGNRYRVRLFEFQTLGDHDYINAVYVNSFKTINRFIAAQTALPATVKDFIKLMLQAKCTCVVNLEPETQRSKTIGKYLPPDNQTVTHGQFKLISKTLISPDAYTVRQVSIRVKSTGKETMVHCFQFNAWPSKETVPNDPTAFIRFVKDVTDKAKEMEMDDHTSPILLHCLSGATKCGLFCAVYNAIEKTDDEQEVSVENIMRQIQVRRRTAFSNKDQLVFCYKAVSAYLDLSNLYTNFELRRQ